MRVLTVATLFLLSSSLVPAIAQQQANPSAQSQPETGQPQTVPVQPERTPQQSEQSRAHEQKRGEDVQVGRDWRTQSRDDDHMGRMGENHMGRMMEHMDHMERMMEHMDRQMRRAMEREQGYYGDRGHGDGYDRGDYDEARRRVKICVEYENGGEYCRYRD
jgi:hypothetical protein